MLWFGNFKIVLIFSLLALNISCSSGKYTGKISYDQKTLTQSFNNSQDNNINFRGYSLGLIKASKYFLSGASFTQAEGSSDQNDRFDPLKLNSIDLFFGVNIRYIKPRYNLRFTDITNKNGNGDRYMSTGLGLIINLPISKNTFLYSTYDKLQGSSMTDSDSNITYEAYQVGLRFNFPFSSNELDSEPSGKI